jgi:hypothetical protein
LDEARRHRENEKIARIIRHDQELAAAAERKRIRTAAGDGRERKERFERRNGKKTHRALLERRRKKCAVRGEPESVHRAAKVEFREKGRVAERVKADAAVGRRCREKRIRWMDLDVSDDIGVVAEKLGKAHVGAEAPDFDPGII